VSVRGLLGLPANGLKAKFLLCGLKVRKKVKLTLEQAMKAQRESKDTALLFL
jgi:hypothetical protein